ncbi:MAG: hypothetical protein ACPGGK_02385 [Pikeienuella sp.]
MKRLKAIFDDRRRAALALDFCADCIVLRHALPDQDWAELGVVPLDTPDFEGDIASLRDQAAAVNQNDLTVELWLPAQQVVNAYVPEGQTDPSDVIVGQAGLPIEELVYDISPVATGGSVVCIAERHVVEEAQTYATLWGFEPILVTTRHADAAFAVPPVLARPTARKRRAALWLAAAAAVVALTVFGAAVWQFGGEAEIEPPMVAFDKVATAPGRVAEPVPLADVLQTPSVEAVAETTPEAASVGTGSADTANAAPAGSGNAGSPDGDAAELKFSLLTDAPVLSPAVLPSQPGGAPAQLSPVHLSFRHPGSAAPPPPQSYSLQEAPIVPPSPQRSQPPTEDVAVTKPHQPSLAPSSNRVNAPMTFAAPIALARAAISGAVQGTPVQPDNPAITTGAVDTTETSDRPDRNALPSVGYSPATVYGAGNTEEATIPSIEEIALALPSATQAPDALSSTTPIDEQGVAETEDTVSSDAEPADENAQEEADNGPTEQAPVAAPAPRQRPEKLDMTPTEFAVLAAPAPDKRPASIVPRPQTVDRPTSARRSSGSTGPALGRAATVRDAIALDDISLLGVFGSVKSRRALLRMPDGAVVRVAKGDVFDGWTVKSIERSKLNISRDGTARTLVVPR